MVNSNKNQRAQRAKEIFAVPQNWHVPCPNPPFIAPSFAEYQVSTPPPYRLWKKLGRKDQLLILMASLSGKGTPEFVVKTPPGEPGFRSLTRGGYNDIGKSANLRLTGGLHVGPSKECSWDFSAR